MIFFSLKISLHAFVLVLVVTNGFKYYGAPLVSIGRALRDQKWQFQMVTALRCVVLLDTFCVVLIDVSSHKVEFALLLFERILSLRLFEQILAHQVFVDVPN